MMLKRFNGVIERDDGTLIPDLDLWCAVCYQPVWANDWTSDLCPWCEATVTDAEFQHAADVMGDDLHRYTHKLRHVYPRSQRREL
ncbi:hypothetical protein HGI16_12175 [Brevibacterium casei]|uniref:hypothetical protein n=1 Tax=Brevibacterium casei TaxID=33889 RepID=UPI00186B58E6|nr:hypothetical protein [Brevibacterium casei]MBE4695455.1 hypothetical protein [Brevibacterium casei]MBY3578577.1 hypothetical protein [Brevibacterium casei]